MDLLLKKECRPRLKKPLGKLISEDLLEEIKNKEIITVGDKVTQTVLERGLKPKLAIVDYKIERKEIKYNYKGFLKKLKAKNKPGQISQKATDKIKESLKYRNCLLEIEGEEDLLVIPLILELRHGIVCYGQPKMGIVVIEINKKKKHEFKELYINCFKNLDKL